MKINVLVRFFIVLNILFSMQSIASPKVNPYKGVVLAEELTESESQLQKNALKQVLIKVSGNVDIVNLDEAKLLENTIPSMLAQFGYQNIDNARFYYALFDKRKINQALTDMQQPVWGDTRPIPLVWLVNEQREIVSEQMLNSSSDVAISWGFKKSELKRGVNAQFPMLDLDDSLIISASDVSGRFYQTVYDASIRYGAEYFVVANLMPTQEGKWQLKWELVHHNSQSKQNEVVVKKTNSGSKSYVMAIMMNEIADYYAQQFAILENNGKKLTQVLTVSGVKTLMHFTRLNNMLSSLNAIDSLETLTIREQQVEVLVTLKGGLMSLENALSVQPSLQRDLSTGLPYQYNWQP